MRALHEDYVCHCQHPHPKMEMGEDSGLCQTCNGIYDVRLYEARLRQYTPNYNYESLHDYLVAVDSHYRELVGASTPE